jgi:hypothetical protein
MTTRIRAGHIPRLAPVAYGKKYWARSSSQASEYSTTAAQIKCTAMISNCAKQSFSSVRLSRVAIALLDSHLATSGKLNKPTESIARRNELVGCIARLVCLRIACSEQIVRRTPDLLYEGRQRFNRCYQAMMFVAYFLIMHFDDLRLVLSEDLGGSTTRAFRTFPRN